MGEPVQRAATAGAVAAATQGLIFTESVDLGGLGAVPVYDPISQIVYAGHRDQVTNVWVGGRRVLADRRLANIDAVALKRAADYWRDRIAEP